MSRFFNIVRTAVSGDKYRYIDDEYNLDLTYITDTIIAMALPAEGVEATYRNNINEVAQFLNAKHPGHYMILNLSERKYNYEIFNNQVLEFPFPDHHNPPLGLLFECCSAIDSWLKADPKNVVAAHCLAGRGRTGTVLACALNFLGMFSTATDALNYFAQKRSEIARGVANPSQRRYVEYFTHVLQGTVDPTPKVFMLRRVLLTSIPRLDGTHIFRPSLHVSVGRKLAYTSVTPPVNPDADDLANYPSYQSKLWSGPKQTRKPSTVHLHPVHLHPGTNQARRSTSSSMVVAGESTATTATFFTPIYSNIVVFNVNSLVSGDVLIRCNHHYKSLTKQSKTVQAMRLGFHTTFLKAGTITVPRTHIDGPHKDLNFKKFDANFAAQLILEEPTEEQKKAHLESNPQEFGVPNLLDKNKAQGATLTTLAQNAMNSRDRRTNSASGSPDPASMSQENTSNSPIPNPKSNRVTVSLDGKGFFPDSIQSKRRKSIAPPPPRKTSSNPNSINSPLRRKSSAPPPPPHKKSRSITPTSIHNSPGPGPGVNNRPLPATPNPNHSVNQNNPSVYSNLQQQPQQQPQQKTQTFGTPSDSSLTKTNEKITIPDSDTDIIITQKQPSATLISSNTDTRPSRPSSAEIFRECSMSLDQQQDLVMENTRLTSRISELLTELNYFRTEHDVVLTKNKNLEATVQNLKVKLGQAQSPSMNSG